MRRDWRGKAREKEGKEIRNFASIRVSTYHDFESEKKIINRKSIIRTYIDINSTTTTKRTL